MFAIAIRVEENRLVREALWKKNEEVTRASSKYKEFRDRFKKMNNEDLQETFKDDLNKPGWVSSRSYFRSALRDEFIARNLPNPY